MRKNDSIEIAQAFTFVLGLHACRKPNEVEHAVLADLGSAFLAAYPAPAEPLSFSELRSRHCQTSKEGGKKMSLWRALKALHVFLEESYPAIPPRGIRWILVTTPGRPRAAYIKAEVDALPSSSLPQPPRKTRLRGREGIRPIWNGKLLHEEFNAAKRQITYQGAMVENVRIIARQIPGKPFGLRFESSPGKGWKFGRLFKRQAEYERAREVFWANELSQRKESAPRLWNGRLWCLAGSRKGNAGTYILDVRRTRFADARFVGTHWKSELPTSLAARGGRRRETFADHCKSGFDSLRAYESVPPVSLVRVGVTVWLSKTNNFLCTTFGSSPKRGLAGQGMCFSVATPEEKARPKLDDQVRRRLVEDVGLATEEHEIEYLAFVQDAGADGELERPWVFAVVETDKSFEQMKEIFDARRYAQFAESIVPVPAVDLVKACSEKDFEHYERSLLIASVLFFASRGAAELDV